MFSVAVRQLGRRATFGLCGLLLSMGAPLGLLILRALEAKRWPDSQWVYQQLLREPSLYVYLAVATAFVMGGLGWQIGRYEEKLAALSDTDALTGLLNRRGFDSARVREIARARRDETPLSVLLIDVDEFKRVNDQYGHRAGDLALIQVGESLTACCRNSDVEVRHGGDEFAVLLPTTHWKEAVRVARRIAEHLRSRPSYAAGASPTTLSMGVAELEIADDADGKSFLARADTAMYAAKAAGKNCVKGPID